MGIKFIIKRGWRFLYLRKMIDKIKKNKNYFILGAPYHKATVLRNGQKVIILIIAFGFLIPEN